jgi:HAMP domain-containing protein
MKATSIKIKVIIVLILSLTIGAAVQIVLVRSSYERNVAMVADSALSSARLTFDNLKSKELSSLALVSSPLGNVDAIRDLFARGDRDGLYAYLLPLYNDLKGRGIPVLTFIDKEGKCFLRMQNLKAFGDSMAAITTIHKAMETKEIAAGVDLARPGLVDGSCRPIRDKDGSLIGYVVVGGTIDQLVTTMKKQTSDDYVLMGYKSFLDEKFYRSVRKAKGEPDTWDQFRSVLVLGKTMEPQMSEPYERDLQDLPAQGKALGRVTIDGRTFIRGVFPLYDAADKAIGGIFVQHDISGLQQGMERVQNLAIVALIALALLLCVAIAIVLQRLVFARLKKAMDTVTRVVGGEFSQKIVPASADEVGKLEELFEQFRTIFVGLVDEVSSNQNNDKKSA